LRRFFAARAAGVNGDGKDLKLSKTKWLAQTHASKVFWLLFFKKVTRFHISGSVYITKT